MSRRIRNLLVASAAVVTAGLMTAGSASALVDLKPSAPIGSWPFEACDMTKHQFIIDAGTPGLAAPVIMCGGKGVPVGPGWAYRAWPGLINNGQHFMSFYEAIGVPDGNTKSEFYPTITVPGMYDIWISYRTTENRTSSAPYYVYADNGQTYRILVNQKSHSDGFRAVKLGNFYFKRHKMDKALVVLENDPASHSEASDGIFIKYTGPGNVTGLTASIAKSTDSIELKWKAVPGATSYRIYRSQTKRLADAKLFKSVKAPAVTFTDTSINEGKTWYYWVKAVGALNLPSKGFSAMATGRTGRTPAVPVVNETVVADANSLTINWGAVTGASSYKVYRGTTDAAADATELASVDTGSQYTDSDLGLGATWWYFVTSVNAIAESARSAGVSGTTAE